MDQDDKHRLTALEGLAALSLDALSSVAYGPEAIVIVLAAAGTAGLAYTLPVTIAIVVLLAVLVISYRQVIEAFPGGGGAYAVAKRHLGQKASLVAGASLTVDYVLNAAVGVSAGVEAFTSAFPSLYGDRVWLCLGVLAIITAANMWGVTESARLFIVPTLVFILAIAVVIVGGLVRSQPVVAPSGHLPQVAESVGILLLLKAFASGCSALTGVEAIANAVPEFKQPQARRAQHTDHDRPAGPGREHVLRRPAGPGQPAGQGQLPAAPVRAQGRAAGLPLRGGRARGRGGGAAGRGQGQYPGPDPGVRHRGLRRLHPVPGRHGEALARAARAGLGRARVHQRSGRGAHHAG